MANNDGQIVLGLDIPKTVSQINADIKKLQNQLKQVKATGALDTSATVKQINKQIAALQSQLKTININTKIDTNNVNKTAQQTGVNIAQNIASGISQASDKVNVEVQKLTDQINKIQFSMDNGYGVSEYQNRIQSLINDFQKYGVAAETAKSQTSSLQQILNNMNRLSGQELVTQADKLEQEFKAVKVSVEQAKIAYDKYMQPVSNEKATSLINRINTFLSKNTRITNSAKIELQGYADELGRGVNLSRWNEINGKLKETENSMRGLHRLGASLRDQMSQAAQSFTQWLSVSSAVMLLVSKTKNAISKLKEINTLITEISKANDKLSKSDLDKIGNNSFDVASKYGKGATDYLSGVQEASRAGYENAEAIAELSVAAQGAGDMTDDLANKYIIATDKAYKLGGSVEKLTEVLDGSNYITNHNAVNMTELAEAMSIVGSTAASFGVEANETTAVLGTMIAATQQSGSEMARAFRAILLNIRQVSDEEEGIDAEGLTKYEKACNALGVSLKETKDGILQTRDAMDVLRDLSVEYNKLEENDLRRTDLLNSVGGKLRANALDAILKNYDMYSKMLNEYAQGTGSMAVEAEKTAKSWEGSMNRLGNTFTKVVNNIVKSDAVIAASNGLNGFLSIIDKITSKLGSLGTLGLGAGLFAGVKNIGKTV